MRIDMIPRIIIMKFGPANKYTFCIYRHAVGFYAILSNQGIL